MNSEILAKGVLASKMQEEECNVEDQIWEKLVCI